MQHLPKINLSKQSAEDIRLGRKIIISADVLQMDENTELDYPGFNGLKSAQSEQQIRLYEQNVFIALAQLQIDSSTVEITCYLQPKRLFC